MPKMPFKLKVMLVPIGRHPGAQTTRRGTLAGMLTRPTAALAKQRARTHRKRARRRVGIRVYPLPLTDRAVSGLMTQLIASGHLTEATAADRACFLAALVRLLEEQGTEWA